MRTFTATPETITNDWYVIDATDKVLGRLATQVAHRLRGKHKPDYTPHMATGDYIVIINAEKIRVTGKKVSDKIYYSHSGYPGGLKHISYEKLMAKNPTMIIEKAVKGMLPSNKLGRRMFAHLKVYSGSKHPHEAQIPRKLEV